MEAECPYLEWYSRDSYAIFNVSGTPSQRFKDTPAVGLGFGRHVLPATYLDKLMHYPHFPGEGLFCSL